MSKCIVWREKRTTLRLATRKFTWRKMWPLWLWLLLYYLTKIWTYNQIKVSWDETVHIHRLTPFLGILFSIWYTEISREACYYHSTSVPWDTVKLVPFQNASSSDCILIFSRGFLKRLFSLPSGWSSGSRDWRFVFGFGIFQFYVDLRLQLKLKIG